MAFSKEQQSAIENLSQMRAYKELPDDLFRIEKEVSAQVIDFILSRQEFSAEDFKTLARLYNKISLQEHYNGSAWLDFKIRLSYFLRQFSHTTSWHADTGLLEIVPL